MNLLSKKYGHIIMQRMKRLQEKSFLMMFMESLVMPHLKLIRKSTKLQKLQQKKLKVQELRILLQPCFSLSVKNLILVGLLLLIGSEMELCAFLIQKNKVTRY